LIGPLLANPTKAPLWQLGRTSPVTSTGTPGSSAFDGGFPWGSSLALRCGSLVRPIGHCVRGPCTRLRHRRLRNWVPSPQTRPFAWPGEGRVGGAIRCRQLQPITMRRTSETDAFSAPRMRTPRGPSRTLKSLHRAVSTSDVLLSPAGTPESESDIRPMR